VAEFDQFVTGAHQSLRRIASCFSPTTGTPRTSLQEALLRTFRAWPRLRDPSAAGA
jgi:hypothetical protein